MKIVCSLDLNTFNHLDHFVPLCDLLDATLFVYTTEDEILLKTYYPKIRYRLAPQDTTLFPLLADSADILVATTKKTGDYLTARCESETGKKLPLLFLPHGQSDKAYTSQGMVTHIEHRFVYGDYMKQQLLDQGVQTGSLFTLGNFRLEYYLKNKPFFDQIVPSHTFTKEKTILYAPTWNDHEHSSSIEQGFAAIDTLAGHYNLIVKLHPLTLKYQPGYYYAVEEKVRDYPHVWFASQIPCIYPLLNGSDAYLGDYSSIGYDFLAFDRPLFFFSSPQARKCEKGNRLRRCGHTLSSVDELPQMLNGNDPYVSERRALYHYAFGSQDPNLIEKLSSLRFSHFRLGNNSKTCYNETYE